MRPNQTDKLLHSKGTQKENKKITYRMLAKLSNLPFLSQLFLSLGAENARTLKTQNMLLYSFQYVLNDYDAIIDKSSFSSWEKWGDESKKTIDIKLPNSKQNLELFLPA